MRRGTLTIQARYVFPVEGEPIEAGCLTIQDGRIGWVGPAQDRRADLDLGNVAIIPGFVNAHTHLELGPLAGNGRSHGVVDELTWLRQVIEQRRAGSELTLRTTAEANVKAAVGAGATF